VEWDFGDGSSNDYNITQTEHQFNGSGTWTVSTTFSNSETSVTIETPVLKIDAIPLPEVQYGVLYTYTAAVPSSGVITATLPSWLTMSSPFTAAGGQRYVTISGYANLPMEDMIDVTYDCTIKAGTVTWETWDVTVKAADTLVPLSKFDAVRDGLEVTVTSQALYAHAISYSVYDALGKFLFSEMGDSHGDAVLIMPADGTYTIKQSATRYGATTMTDWSTISVNVLTDKSDAADEDRQEQVDPLPEPPYADISVAVLVSLLFGGLTFLFLYTGRWGMAGIFALLTIVVIAGSYLVISGEISWIPRIEWRH
jgi:PKD repeat protein